MEHKVKQFTNMTRRRYQKASGTILLCLLLTGCGGGSLGQKNPLAKAEKTDPALNDVQPSYKYNAPVPPTPKTYSTITPLVQFTTDGATIFTQGEPGVITINITGPIRQTNANYKLILANQNITALGATVQPTSTPWQWQLKWTPPTTLTADQPTREFQVPVQFVLTGTNLSSLQSTLAGQTIEAPLDITLAKDETVPVVQNVTPETTKINAGQDVTIDFNVLAKAYGQASNISVHKINGTCDLNENHEYPLCDGSPDATEPVLIKTAPAANGYTQFTYRSTFSGQDFADQMYPRLAANGYWNWKVNAGEITFAEARFSFEAVNSYNHEWSADQNVAVDVTLNTQAGQPSVVSGTSHVTVKAGETALPTILLGTDGGRGALAIQSVKFNNQTINVRNGQARIQENGLNIALACSDAGVDLNKHVNCHTGACIQTCTMQVDADCSLTSSHDTLILNAKSTLGRSSKSNTITLPIDVSGQSNQCATMPAKRVKRVIRKGAKT